MPPRRPDDEPAGLPPEWADFVVPDDASALAEESRAVRRQLYGASRRGGVRGLFWTRRWWRREPSGLVVLVVLVVALFIASLGMFWQPAAPKAPAPRPLAQSTAIPGTADALLPDLAVTTGRTGSVRLRTMRPAVLVVLPAACACSRLVDEVIRSTAASRLKVLVIGQTGDPPVPSTAPRSRVTSGTDAGGRLAATYQAGPAALLLFVRSDGTVSRVMRDAEPGAEVRQEVAGLAH